MAKLEKTILLYKGADTDTDIEISTLEEGVYVSSVNMRSTHIGSKGARAKIGGEQVVNMWDSLTDDDGEFITDNDLVLIKESIFEEDYDCIGGIAFDSYRILIFASRTPGVNYPIITVNEEIMISSSGLLFTYDHPVECIATSSGDYITLFLNDRETVPLIFDINDVINSYEAGSEKYFDDFDIEKYAPKLNIPLDVPKFSRIIPLSGSGLKAGKYSYQLRYVSDDGVGTAWSVPSPFIPVPGSEDSSTNTPHAGEMAFGKKGGEPGYYGISLNIRVANEFEYAYLELKRTSHYNGLEHEADPIVEKIKVNIDIKSQPYATVNFIDSSSLTWEKYDDLLELDTQIISKAASIRYYKGSFIIMNPTYGSKEIDSTDLFLFDSTYGKLASVYLENIGDSGYGKVDNQVNKLSLMRGEKYGWYLIAHDGSGGRSFAVPWKSGITDGVNDFTDFQIPNRRVALDAQEVAIASGDMSDCATTASGAGASHAVTHEVFKPNPKTKTDSFINICEARAYSPLTPTGSESVGVNSNNRAGYAKEINNYYDGSTHHQAGFCNEIVSAGMQFAGVDISKFPDYIKAFSIVRTKPAGRVVAQGLGFYALTPGTTPATGAADKDLNSMWFMSPDIDPFYGIDPGLFDDIINNPSRYKIQLVSPLGFHTEMYSPNDMAVYAEILYDNSIHNMDAAAAIGRGDGYVSFGRWRNGATAPAAVEGSADFIFDIASASVNTLDGKNDRVQFLTLNFNENLYSTDGTIVNELALSTDANMKKWHEPVYIVNIINVDATAKSNDVISCVDTGHIQKLESVIAVGNGEDFKAYLVNERPEDCISSAAGDLAFIEVGGNKWLDVTYELYNSIYSWHQSLLTDGYFTSNGVNYYGMYKNSSDINGVYLYFSWTENPPVAVYKHTGLDNQPVLADNTAAWGVNALVGKTVYNLTDMSSGVVVSNTATTATTAEPYIDIVSFYNASSLITGYQNIGGAPNVLEFQFSDADFGLIVRIGDQIVISGTDVYDGTHSVTNIGALSFQVELPDLGDPGVDGVVTFASGGFETVVAHDDYTFTDLVTVSITDTVNYNGDHSNIRVMDINHFAIASAYLGTSAGTVHGLAALAGGSDNDWDTDDIYSIDTESQVSVVFEVNNPPADGDKIVVKYNSSKPIIVFGGDTYIGTAIAPFIDTKATYAAYVDASPDVFALHRAFPNYQFKFVTGYHAPYGGHIGDEINTTETYNINYIRQMIVAFTCESRMNLNMLYNDSFPKKHYVPRPVSCYDLRFGDGAIFVYKDHHLNAEQYYLDYKDEYLYWLYGGFGIPMFSNKDYSRQFLPGRNFTRPQIGYVERLNFPNSILYSLQRRVPGFVGAFKAFPVENKYTISDKYGEIVFAWDANSDKGNNLYAIAKRAVCLLLTDKNLLYSYTGEEVGMTGGGKFIQAELWLSNYEGVDYDNFRTIAEYKNILFMANSHGVYMVAGSEVLDITDTFRKELEENLFPYLSETLTPIKAVVDFLHKEYWLSVSPDVAIELTDDNGDDFNITDDNGDGLQFTQHKVFVYDIENKKWAGMFEYNGEAFLSNDSTVYLVRDNDIYALDSSRVMNKNIVESSITARVSPEFGKECDFDRIKIFSTGKPDAVEFSDDLDLLPQATLDINKGHNYLKDYGFWTNKIPISDVDRYRIQGRTLIVKVSHSQDEDFIIKAIGVKYRKLRAQ